MPLCKILELNNSVEIKISPETTWNFFKRTENYTTWHPKDHIKFIWTEGKPLDVGSTFYSEKLVFGNVFMRRERFDQFIYR
jgi:hypothetical protein